MTTENYQLHSQLITKGDLIEFRNNLISEIKEIVGNNSKSPSATQWLKSSEVREMLKISTSTLQTHRVNGTLNYSKLGSSYYYKLDDILKILNQ